MAATLALPNTYALRIAKALEVVKRPPVVWLELQDCAGDTESLLRALISSAHEKKIRDFMKAHPELEHFGEIKEALGAGIDYYEIKLVHDLMEGE